MATKIPVPLASRVSRIARFAALGICFAAPAPAAEAPYVYEAGHPSLRVWLLPATPPSPNDNKTSSKRADLGKRLFFDPRLSGTGKVTCASCHLPEKGWTDGLPTAVRYMGKVMPLASPTIVNIGYNSLQMWDGRMPTLEKQAFGGQAKAADVNAGSTVEPDHVIARLNTIKGYVEAFAQAYPGEGLTRETVAKAIAAFERTVVSNNSPFDRWVKGDRSAMSATQVRGFKAFVETARCAVCHAPPNFTDNGFHNIGLKSYGVEGYHPGRFARRKLKIMDGAFKTPTLRDIALTAPYFHDGSAASLPEVVDHYEQGGVVKTNLSPNLPSVLILTQEEKDDIVAFMEALTSERPMFVYPVLPQR